MNENNNIERRFFIKIRLNKDSKYESLAEVYYYRTDMTLEFYFRWKWYFDYRAALVRVQNPKAFIEYTCGSYEYILPADEYKNKVYNLLLAAKRYYPEIMSYCPSIVGRITAMNEISRAIKSHITIEPVMDFDLDRMVDAIKLCRPVQVNIGADTGNHDLPEPPKEKVLELITALSEFTKIKQKSNLKRLLK
ncbi:MAG: hypothetical protein LBJ72_08525 [Dysgonamonadaceae bacterium]|jgi:hypothetical protein|nr:hypothetical protein [Dysgonamonadaceae bacterium]